MKLTEMKQLLAAHNLRLTKSLGQNFLHDANQLRRLVAAAELSRADCVLEIGPGLGPLTGLLLEQAGEVLAVEKDARLVTLLRERFNAGQARPEATPALELVHDDALDYLRREPRDWTGWKMVSNLPYSVASPIIVELAQAHTGPERMVVTLQLEVAKRLLAKPATPDYGVLTLLVQAAYEPKTWFKVPASCFFPEPDVDSACVCLVRRAEPLLAAAQRDLFAAVVKCSFSQRRKMMLKLLKEDWPEARLLGEFERLGLSTRARAEEVSLEQFAQLARGLSAPAP